MEGFLCLQEFDKVLPRLLIGLALLHAVLANVAPAQTLPAEPDAPQSVSAVQMLGSGSYTPRLGVEHRTEGAGYQHSFTSFNGFLPLLQDAGNSLTFLDARFLLANDAAVGANVGLGYRLFSETFNSVVGAYVFYDNRDTGNRSFNQVSGGFEVLGPWDFRTNWYVPVGEDRKVTQEGIVGTRFSGQNILVDRFRRLESAMAGFDMEVGAALPRLGNLLRAYAGYYYLGAEGDQDAWGVKGRVEGRLTDMLTLHLSVQNDRLFETNLTAGVAVTMPGYRPRGSDNDNQGVLDRFAQAVERNQNIAVHQKTVVERVLATDPMTGAPIIVLHANSAAARGGDGSVDRPFNTLNDLQTASVPAQILFLQANSEFRESLVLRENQRLLGDGIRHRVYSSQGDLDLPILNSGSKPTIQFAPGNAVVLANGNEVSGLTIINARGQGISGIQVASFNLNRNVIQGSMMNGILIEDATGPGKITDNELLMNGSRGIRLRQHKGIPAQSVLLSGNTFSSDAVDEFADIPISVSPGISGP